MASAEKHHDHQTYRVMALDGSSVRPSNGRRQLAQIGGGRVRQLCQPGVEFRDETAGRRRLAAVSDGGQRDVLVAANTTPCCTATADDNHRTDILHCHGRRRRDVTRRRLWRSFFTLDEISE